LKTIRSIALQKSRSSWNKNLMHHLTEAVPSSAL
jgi:hypothetical protein